MMLKLTFIFVLGAICTARGQEGVGIQSGSEIVAKARSQIGVHYVWGGGDKHGPTHGGFDCSGLTIYSVYQATGKTIPRVSHDQYISGVCSNVPLNDRLPGDLIFWGNPTVHHVAVVSARNKVIHAPHPGVNVHEADLFTLNQLMSHVKRCW